MPSDPNRTLTRMQGFEEHARSLPMLRRMHRADVPPGPIPGSLFRLPVSYNRPPVPHLPLFAGQLLRSHQSQSLKNPSLLLWWHCPAVPDPAPFSVRRIPDSGLYIFLLPEPAFLLQNRRVVPDVCEYVKETDSHADHGCRSAVYRLF